MCHTGTRRSPIESDCPERSRPPSSQSCHVAECPSRYQWREGDWQACSKSCGSGHRRRDLQCVDEHKRDVHEMYCVNQIRPPDIESCNAQACEFVWITGEWTECSVSCGQGYRQRRISCSEVHMEKDNYEYGHQSLSNCPGTPPERYKPCHLESCAPLHEWRVGTWGPCSASCGDGVMERAVHCVKADGQRSKKCSLDAMPEARKVCRNLSCHLPTSCQDVQHMKGVLTDGDHLLNIQGNTLKVYCAGMQTENPREYITLTTGEGENFSEIFGFRLNDPSQCPSNQSRREDCDCRRDYAASGFTTFSKVRLDLIKMNIITTDWQFSLTPEGNRVPFGTAGDCYSASQCPQGRFSINLSGTGFKVAADTLWTSQGNYAVADIRKSQDGSRVLGTCGGYCGKCTPASSSLLHITVA